MAQAPPPVQPPAAPVWRRVPSVRPGIDGRHTELCPEWADVLHPSFRDTKYYSPGCRPALMPNDAGWKPTREALRFGIYTGAIDEVCSRSLMTPIDGHGFGAVRTAQMDDIEEDYQSLILSDFNVSELLNNGAYAPEAWASAFSSTSFQQDVLSPLLARDRWKDNPQGNDLWDPVLRHGLDPDVEFNIQRSDQVWEAIRPALALVTRILKVHPFFATITNPCK